MTVFWIVAAAVAVFVLAVLVAANKIFNVAVKAKAPKEKVFTTNSENREGLDRTQAGLDREWLARQTFEERRVASFDGLSLFGRILYAARPTHRWVIGLHGFSGNGLNLGVPTRHFYEHGYHCLLPDLRACGKSEGVYMGMGWLDARDLLLWIDTILSIDTNAQIVLWGASMGGATVMMTTGYDLPGNVAAAVEDCGYTTVWDEFTIQLKKVFHLPQFPIMHIVNVMAKHRAGYSFREASSIAQVKKSRIPTLFIHGAEDRFVPFFMLDENYGAAACPKEKLAVAGAGHAVSMEVAPALYWNTVDAFLGKYLEPKAPLSAPLPPGSGAR